MALNPIAFTENVVKSFLRYQFTTYAFADERLAGQMRDLLSLDATGRSPLLKGPYVSLSRPFREGASVDDLIAEGLLHPHMRQRIPAEITHVYGHQEDAIRAICAGRTTLVSTGTGSGKTECFLYPIISRCLTLRDEGAAPGISAVIIYPMNALAEDQLMRLRSLLAGTGITFGMYVGKTPEHENEVAGIRLPEGTSRVQYEAKLEQVRAQGSGETVYPFEKQCSREAMRRPGGSARRLRSCCGDGGAGRCGGGGPSLSSAVGPRSAKRRLAGGPECGAVTRRDPLQAQRGARSAAAPG